MIAFSIKAPNHSRSASIGIFLWGTTPGALGASDGAIPDQGRVVALPKALVGGEWKPAVVEPIHRRIESGGVRAVDGLGRFGGKAVGRKETGDVGVGKGGQKRRGKGGGDKTLLSCGRPWVEQ
jgi:hypothetical protein